LAQAQEEVARALKNLALAEQKVALADGADARSPQQLPQELNKQVEAHAPGGPAVMAASAAAGIDADEAQRRKNAAARKARKKARKAALAKQDQAKK
jgi:hypothetical protein